MLAMLVTVGGSPQPIISAIRAGRPDQVVFLCSGGSEGTPGSDSLVPAIAEGCDLPPSAVSVVAMPADDPDTAILIIREVLARLRTVERVICDYTGGTKSMSAALVHAAVASGRELQFMVGRRSDLVRVADGTERPARLSMDFAVAERRVGRLIDAWSVFGYEEAVDGFTEIYHDLVLVGGVPPAFLSRVAGLRDLSKGFAKWDQFDHHGARALIDAADFDEVQPYRPILDRLLASETREPAILFDLWHNAMRAAARGRYDDATARLYRLLEWTAQWMLRYHCGIDTGDVDPLKVPETSRRHLDLSEKPVRVPMGKGWSLVEEMLPDRPLRVFMRSKRHSWNGYINREHRNRWARARNYSILAHGDSPIDKTRWETEILPFPQRFITALREEAKQSGFASDPVQLPRRPPASLLG